MSKTRSMPRRWPAAWSPMTASTSAGQRFAAGSAKACSSQSTWTLRTGRPPGGEVVCAVDVTGAADARARHAQSSRQRGISGTSIRCSALSARTPSMTYIRCASTWTTSPPRSTSTQTGSALARGRGPRAACSSAWTSCARTATSSRCLWSTRGADLTWRGRRSADHRCSQAGCQRVARDGRCLSALSSGSCSSNARPCQFRWRGRCLALGIPTRRPQPRGAVSVAARASQGCPRSARRLRRP